MPSSPITPGVPSSYQYCAVSITQRAQQRLMGQTLTVYTGWAKLNETSLHFCL